MSEFRPAHERDLTLVEVLDRVVERGVVLSGDITITVAGVDLIYLGLRVLIRTPFENGTDRSTSRQSNELESTNDGLLRVRDHSEHR
jgi:gas vesicle structural protein